MSGDRDYIQKLTQGQKDAVISAFTDRELQLKKRLSRLETENREQELQIKELTKRTASAPSRLRDSFLAERIVQIQQREASLTPAPTTASESASRIPTSAAKSEMSEHNEFEFSSSSLIEGTPALAQAPRFETPKSGTPSPRRSFFGSLFKTITTPFSLRKSATPTTSPTAQPEQPKLGELPASRKRSAPEPEPDSERRPTPPAPEPQQHRSEPASQLPRITISGTPKRVQPSQANTDTVQTRTGGRNLTTISEHTEPSEQTLNIPEPTPTRQPRRIRDTMRRSTVRPPTPARAWTPQPAPREPNADRRLEKLRKFKELDEQLKAMKKDPETKDIVERPMKRVKIDHLVSIPHNRPGDSKSTFRMFEIDSDEEMEVDEEVEERSNVFENSTQEETPKALEAPARSTESGTAVEAEKPKTAQKTGSNTYYKFNWSNTDTETIVEMINPKKAAKVFRWESFGPRTTSHLAGAEMEAAAAKFAYGMAQFEATGQLIHF